MKQLIMTVGLPFSGKSSAVKEFAAQGYEVIERDEVLRHVLDSDAYKETVDREGLGLTGRDLFDVENRIAIRLLSERVREMVRLSSGERIIYDGTNLQRASRAGILELRNQGVEVSAIIFRTPLPEILRRAEAARLSGEREWNFNEQATGALKRMIEMLEDPNEDEGFNNIEVRDWKSERVESHEGLRR